MNILFETKRIRIDVFNEYGLAIIFQPHWSIYFLIGFIGINIQLNRDESVRE